MDEKRVVLCQLEYVTIQDEDGQEMEGIEITCPLCEEQEISPGIDDESVGNCLAYLSEECDCQNILVVK